MIMAKEDVQSIVLIDYGCASHYRNQNGKHFEQEKVQNFEGNILFASLDSLNFIKPSRRSDIESVCYMMLYLLNDLEMPLT